MEDPAQVFHDCKALSTNLYFKEHSEKSVFSVNFSTLSIKEPYNLPYGPFKKISQPISKSEAFIKLLIFARLIQ